MKELIRRVIEIARSHRDINSHGHIASSLSALPVIVDIYKQFDHKNDVFILSKGHACVAWFAVLESHGFHPNVMKVHPDIDPANGIPSTTGSLGHGLPTAVGIAYAKKFIHAPGHVHVLLGDGECLEGTTWESLNVARRYNLDNLTVHVDDNGWQGSCRCLDPSITKLMNQVFPIKTYGRQKGFGVKLFEAHPDWHVHFLTDPEFQSIMSEL